MRWREEPPGDPAERLRAAWAELRAAWRRLLWTLRRACRGRG